MVCQSLLSCTLRQAGGLISALLATVSLDGLHNGTNLTTATFTVCSEVFGNCGFDL